MIGRWRLPEGDVLQDRIEQMIRPALCAGFFGESYTRYVAGLQYHLGGRTDTTELASLANPFLRKNSCSQLALLSDDAYCAGIDKIENALKDVESCSEMLIFRTGLSIHILQETDPWCKTGDPFGFSAF